MNDDLSHWQPEVLSLIAKIFTTANIHVVLSERAHGMTVVLESRTLVCHPKQTSLYDIAIGARLMRYRSARKDCPFTHPKKRNRWLTKQAMRWVREARTSLSNEFPGIDKLKGRFREKVSLRVTEKEANFRPLQPTTATRVGNSPEHLSAVYVPELQITGGDDYAWLVDEITKGNYPLSHLPGLDALPYVRIPFTLVAADHDPLIEKLDSLLKSPQTREMINSLKQCHIRKSEVRGRRVINTLSTSGAHLDMQAVIRASVDQDAGLDVMPKVFRKKSPSGLFPIFNPKEHVVCLVIDLNDIHSYSWESGCGVMPFVSVMVQMLSELQINDVVVMGFADQFVTLPNGRVVNLHFISELKSISTPFSVFWHRLSRLVRAAPKFPGTPEVFHPLSWNDALGKLKQISDGGSTHSCRTLCWFARRAISWEFPQFASHDFSVQMAGYIDRSFDSFAAAYPEDVIDHLPVFLPQRLRNNGQPGKFLSRVEYG